MNFKLKLLTAVASCILLSASAGLHQTAQAEDTWSSILKPLVSSVVMPLVDKGIDAMKAKITKNKATPETSAFFSEVQVEALSSAETSAAEMSWKLPEEPSHY